MYIFGTNIDLNKNEAKKFRVENALNFPSVVSADKGYTFFHTGQNLPYMYDGSSWLALANQPGSGISGIQTQDDGVTVITSSQALNFTGAGVVVTDLGSGVTGISITGGDGGSAAIEILDEGNGDGYIVSGSDRTKHGNVGFHSFDFTWSDDDSEPYGALANYTGAFGQYNAITGVAGFGAGYYNRVGGFSSASFGTENYNPDGDNYCMLFGRHNRTIYDYGMMLGLALHTSSAGMTAVGQANIERTLNDGINQPDAPMFVVGIGSVIVGPNSADVRKDGFEVIYNGEVNAVSLTNVIIDAESTGKTVITRNYLTRGFIVSGLPSGTVGDRAYVTDANATTFMSTVSGGGSNIVPVFYNGTNWVIA